MLLHSKKKKEEEERRKKKKKKALKDSLTSLFDILFWQDKIKIIQKGICPSLT